MNSLVKALKDSQTKTFTENGMPAKNSTSDKRLDFFYKVPSQRKVGMKQKYDAFVEAFSEDPTYALRLLFWLRDIKEGSGERNTFQGIINLAAINGKFKEEHIKFIPEFGRWDDVLSLVNTPLESQAVDFYANALKDGNALAAKWCPRMSGRHKSTANKIRKSLKLNMKNYRLLLSRLSKTVETQMCARKWDEIKYDNVPSLAMSRYTNAFMKRDEERFSKFIIDGNVKTGTLFPHDVMRQYNNIKNTKSKVLVNATWKSLPNDVVSEDENIIPVVDVSGSMTCRISGSVSAMDVSVSMGMYLAQRMSGAFKNKFITFHSSPSFVDIGERTFCEAVPFIKKSPWGMSTNIEAVFKLILSTAVDNKVPASDMPTKVVIFSDMQFNSCAREPSASFISMVRGQYEEAGYELPRIIFWNLNSKSNTVNHADASSKTTLVSGFSTRLMKSIFNDTNIEEEIVNTVDENGKIVEEVVKIKTFKTPVEIMDDVILSDRYAEIFWSE